MVRWITRMLRSSTAVAAMTAAPLFLAASTATAAQVPERDRLLNCFYEARESNPDQARSCLATLLDMHPADVQALLELGFFEIAQKRDAAAIDALSSAVAAGSSRADVRAQLGYLYLARQEPEPALESFRGALAIDPSNEQVRMQTAYLLDAMGREREAKQVFEVVERETRDVARRRQACAAAEVLAPLANRRLRDPYFVDIYAAPDWYSNIDVATLPLRLRAGVTTGPGDRIELFGENSLLADNESTDTTPAGPVIFFDNVNVISGGASVQPFSSIGLSASVNVGGAYDLVVQESDRWRLDVRTGLQYYGAWQYASRCPSGVTMPMRPVLEVYGSSFYFSRYENVISFLRVRPGLRVLETARLSLDANLHVGGSVDTVGEDFNNLFELGGGAILTPDRRFGLRIGFETVHRQFKGGTHDVVTRVRVEYGARF
jgi:tetratricopeptide (TPR) repeat protein